MKKVYTLLAYIWFVLAVLAPSVSLHNLTIRPEDYILLLLLFFVILKKILTLKLGICLLDLLIIASLFSFIVLLLFSSSYNLIFYNAFSLELFLKELFRFTKYILVYIAFSQFTLDYFYRFGNLILICTNLTIFIQLSQIFDLFNINNFIRNFYALEATPFLGYTSYSLLSVGLFRGGSVFLNYNVFGNFLLIPLSYVLLRIMSYKDFNSKTKNFFKILSYSFQLLLILIGILLTQSRTAFLSAVSILVTLYFIMKKRIERKYLIGISVFILIGIFIISTLFNLKRVFMIMEAFTESEGSGFIKYDLLKKVIGEMSLGNFFIGHGLGQFFQVDFEYGYLIYFYGIVGLILYIFFMLLTIKLLSTYNTYESFFFISLIISFLIFGLGATSFLNVRVFPIFLALLSTYTASLRNKNFGGNLYANTSV